MGIEKDRFGEKVSWVYLRRKENDITMTKIIEQDGMGQNTIKVLDLFTSVV
jgi:hypothetical protein